MRLGQLSRKISTKTLDIIEYLNAAHNIELSHHPNTKIPEEYIELIEKHFKTEPEITEEESSTPQQEASPALVGLSPPEEFAKETEQKESIISEESEELNLQIEPSDSIQEVELHIVDGVIKAPKVEMTGPKIIGKIHLPEPKKPETESIDESEDVAEHNEESETVIPLEEASLKPFSRPERTPRPVRKTNQHRGVKRGESKLTPDQERKIKLQQLQQQKIEAHQSSKVKRRERYLEESKAKIKSESSKALKQKKNSNVRSSKHNRKDKPKSLWGRFIYWLND